MSTERKAAIEQFNAAVTAQRDAIVRELDARKGKLRQLLGNAQGVVERAEKAGISINTATDKTITMTEQATRRTMDHAFRLAVLFIVLLLAAIPAAVLLHRWAKRRGLRGPVPPAT